MCLLGSKLKGWSFFQVAIWACHAEVSPGVNRLALASSFRRPRAYFTSLTSAIATRLFLLCSEASMSMWTIVALAANLPVSPVMRSSKRAPRTSRRSASSTAQLP